MQFCDAYPQVFPQLDGQIDVAVADGWLTLEGEVTHQSESDAAFEAVERLPGVGGITNKIKVITAGIHG